MKVMYLAFKNLKGYYCVPLGILFVLLPFLISGIVAMGIPVESAYYQAWNEVEKYVPLFSVWWATFIFKEYIEGEGNELFYGANPASKLKLKMILGIYGWYMLHVGVLFMGFQYLWGQMLSKFVIISIQCFFFTALFYCLVYLLKSTTITFMLIFVYEILVLFSPSESIQAVTIYCSVDSVPDGNVLMKYGGILGISLLLLGIGARKNLTFYQ